MKMATTVIKDFVVRNRHFTIVKDEDANYLAIEDKYITDGKINRTLNGFQMFASKDVNDCMKSCANQVEIDYLIAQGNSKAVAFCTVFNIMDRLEAVEKMFA